MFSTERKGGEAPMKKLVDRLLENLSTRDFFLFQVTCGACGTAYGRKQIPFSKAGITPQTSGKRIIYDACYEQELMDARHVAVREAAEHLNFCPICKRVVCNRCFLICDDLDMCQQCAAHLEESGSPVVLDVLDLAT